MTVKEPGAKRDAALRYNELRLTHVKFRSPPTQTDSDAMFPELSAGQRTARMY